MTEQAQREWGREGREKGRMQSGGKEGVKKYIKTSEKHREDIKGC